MKILRKLTLGLMFGGLGFPVMAGTITFNSATTGSFFTADYVEDGILLDLITGHYDITGCSNATLCAVIDPVSFGNSVVRLSLVGGGTFSLTSIDVLEGTGQITSSNPTALVVGLGTVVNPVGFQNITFFDIAHDPGVFMRFDNISLNAVPEPSSIGLVGAGIAAMLALRRRRLN